MKLIVGLGNPGTSYAGNRHNVGAQCLNYFAKKQRIKLDRSQGKARVGRGNIGGTDVLLARPQTYMNVSGEPVARLVNLYKVEIADLVVIHDDLDLPAGKIRLRAGGSSGGHNGVQSIIERLGSPDFIRLKIGIDHPTALNGLAPDQKESLIIQYVLSDFTPEESKVMEGSLSRAGEAILTLITSGLNAAMNQFN